MYQPFPLTIVLFRIPNWKDDIDVPRDQSLYSGST